MKSLKGKDVAGMLGNVRVLAVVAAVALIALSFLAFLSCSRSKGGPASGLSYLDKNADFAGSRPGGAGSLNSAAGRTLSIEEAIAEVKAYEPPAEVTADAGFDPQVFEMLRDELVRQIEARGIRAVDDADFWAKAVPEVVRFEESLDGSVDLVWIERNVGDYDANGEVGIPDITPIAQNYLAKPSEAATDEEREKLELIDGDRDDEIGITDITPIAVNYSRGLAGYDVLRPGEGGGEYIKLPNPNDPGNENAISARRTEANESGENVERLGNALPPLYRYEIEPEHAPSSLGPMRSVSESGGRYYYVISPRESEDAPAPEIPNVAPFLTMSPVAGAAPLTISIDVTVFGGTQPFTVTMLWESASIGDAEQFTGLMCDGTDPLITHTFEAPGEYYPQLTLTDSTGYATGRSLGKVTVDDTLLPAPSGVTVEEGPVLNSATVNWEPVTNAKGYNVYFSLGISDKDPSLANMFPLETGPYTVTNLVPGFTYFFRVATLNANDAEGPMSAAVPHTNYGGGIAPDRPENLVASQGTSSDSVFIAWSSVVGANQYRVYRSYIQEGPYSPLPSGLTDVSNYEDDSIISFDKYWYRISSINPYGESDLSNEVSGYAMLDNVQHEVTGGTLPPIYDGVKITWLPVSGASWYTIHRLNLEPYELIEIGWVSGASTEYLDDSDPDHELFYYNVIAHNYLGSGLESAFIPGYRGWEILIVDDVGDVGAAVDLSLEDRTYPHIAYYDLTNGFLKQAQLYSTIYDWLVRTVDNNGYSTSGFIGIESLPDPGPGIDGGEGIAYLGYVGEDELALKYAHGDFDFWTKETITTDGSGFWLDFEINNAGWPSISCFGTNGIRLFQKDESGWISNTFAYDNLGGMGTSLGFDSEDNPIIAFQNYVDLEKSDLCIIRWNLDQWNYEVIDETGCTGAFPSLDVYEDGRIGVAYCDLTPYYAGELGFDLLFTEWDGDGWSKELVVGLIAGGQKIEMHYDDDGNPAIAFMNASQHFAWRRNGVWKIYKVDNVPVSGFDCSFEFNIDGYPEIAYYVYTRKEVRYARW